MSDIKIDGEYNGLPYRGPALNIKSEDSEPRLPTLRNTVKIRTFKISDEKDRAEYEKICQLISDGLAQQSFEEIKWVDKETGWVAMVRWVELWYGPPKEVNYVAKG